MTFDLDIWNVDTIWVTVTQA